MKTRRDYLTIICTLILICILLLGIFAPLITSYNPNTINVANKFAAPSIHHLLGTDYLGRDLFTRVIYGSRTTLLLGVVLTIVILVVGIILGSIAAFFGGWIDQVIISFCTIFITFPSEMLGLIIIAIIGPSFLGVVLAITLSRWPWYVQMIRNDINKIIHTNYIQYAKLLGSNKLTIFRKHIIKNIFNSLVVYATLDMGALIVSIASLSFLGIGIQAPTAEWGRMLSDAQESAMLYPWQIIPAGIAIFTVTLCLNYIGDAISK